MSPFDFRLLREVPQAREPVAWLGVLAAVAGVLAVVQVFAVVALVMAVVRGAGLTTPSVAVLVVLALRALVAGATEWTAAWSGARVAGLLRRWVLTRWLSLPGEDRPDGSAMAILSTQGAASVEPYVARYLATLVVAAVVPPLAILTLLATDWLSGLVVILTIGLLPLFAALIGRYTQAQTEARWHEMSRLAGHFLDVMRGLPTLVGYQRAQAQVEVIETISDRHRRATVRTLRTAFLSSAALELLTTISVAIVAVVVGLRLVDGGLDLRTGLTAILLAPEAFWPIRRVGQEFHAAADGAKAVEDLLDAAGAGSSGTIGAAGGTGRREHASEDSPRGVLEVRGLGYRFPGARRPLWEGLAAVFPPMLTVVTGASGSGKSTLLELLAGLRRPESGRVIRPAAGDGSGAGPSAGRAPGRSPEIHLVTQRPYLVPGTVRANLALGHDRPVRAASVPTALRALPDGLDTRVGDDGAGLSAGQRALLALARAELSGAAVVLVDEPTAHLDEQSADAVHHALRRLARTRIVVAVTHRPELVGLADQHLRLSSNGLSREDGSSPALPTESPDLSAPFSADDPDVRRPPETPETAEAPGSRPPGTTERAIRRSSGHPRRGVARPARGTPAAAILGALASGCGVALTATSGWLIVQASTHPAVLTLMVAIVGVRAFGIGRPVFRYFERVRSHDAALTDLVRRRTELYAALIPLTPARLGRCRRADLLTSVVSDLDDEVGVQVRSLVPLIAAGLTTLAAVAGAHRLCPPAGAVLALITAGAVALAVAGWALERRSLPAVLEARALVGRPAQAISTNTLQLRAMGGAADLLTELDTSERDAERAVRRHASGRALMTGLTQLLTGVTVVLMAGVVLDGRLSAPVAAMLVLGPLALGDVLGTLPDAVSALARGQAARARLARLLDQRPAVQEAPDASTPAVPGCLPTTPELTLERVCASWDGARDQVAGIGLSVGPGERVELRGPNGAGKSTVLAILARHLDPSGGCYTVDGRDARSLPLLEVRGQIALVDDEPHVFGGSVRANLVLARPGAPDDAVLRCLAAAGLGPWSGELPDGLDTLLGVGGRGLSGGERARLAIARALLSRRRVLLLDEPVAHLDAATARGVLDDLAAAAGGRSVVVVSHQDVAALRPHRTVSLGGSRHVVSGLLAQG